MGAKVSTTSSEISITKQNVEELPYVKSVTEFTKCKSVNITRSSIRAFPKQLSSDLMLFPPIIDTLVELDLSGNELEIIPDQISLLVNLRKLRLDGNLLTQLPDSFPALYKLEKLYLDHNELKELPLDMGNLKHLRFLRLHNNRLPWIPNDIGKMPLEELTIHENPLPNEVLDLMSLDEVLRYFRHQTAPTSYSKALKLCHQQVKIKDGLHELKDGRLHAFRVMLASEECKYFEAFLAKEFATENLQFYRDADSFREKFPSNFPIVSKDLAEAGMVIYKKYMEERPEENKYCINIPSSVKKGIDEVFGAHAHHHPNQWVFADAYVAVAKLMFEDPFKRFLETAEGKKVWPTFEAYIRPAKSSKKKKDKEKEKEKDKKKSKNENSKEPEESAETESLSGDVS